MIQTLFRTFLLLFLPVLFWVIYSCLPNTYHLFSFVLPKMDKIEFLSYILNTSKTGSAPLVVQKNEIDDKENISTKIKPESNLSATIESSVIQLDKNESLHDNDEQEVVLKEDTVQQIIPLDFNNTDENQTSKKIKIFLIGDSMGEGIAYGFSHIKRKYPIEFQSIAKSSTTTYYWNSYTALDQKILDYRPNVVMIVLGTNEWNGVNSSTKLRILKLHRRLEELGIQVVWVTPPVKKASRFFDIVHDVFGASTYDSRNLNVPRGSDHVHPTPKGYILWSRQILAALNIKEY